MSNNDSFIDEVTEEVRRDKLFALMRRYGWIAVLGVILIVGGAAWTEWQKSRHQADSRAFGDALLAAMQADDPAARQTALAGVAAGGGRKAVLDLLQSAEALAAQDKAAALEQLAAVAADATLPEAYRQMASLKSVLIAGDEMDAATRDTTLAGLAQPGAPFRVLAMEQQALVLAEGGKTDEALALFRQILEEPDLTQGLRARVQQMIVALGGEAAAA